MTSIEDLMTPEERIKDLEKSLSEAADDALVESKLAAPRATRIVTPSNGYGMVMMIKDDPRVQFKLDFYPNETEEPHFKVIYKGTTCRFKISDCSPMKAEAKRGIPTPIKHIMKEIKKTWKNRHEDIVRAWIETRPSDQNHGHQRIR